jgi:hypothetical protein
VEKVFSPLPSRWIDSVPASRRRACASVPKRFGWRRSRRFATKSRHPIMGSLKKRRKAKINKHKRRKKLRLNRHKKRTWQK